MLLSDGSRCAHRAIARPLGNATIFKVIGHEHQEYVVSIPCKFDGLLLPSVLAIRVCTAERAAAWAAAVGKAPEEAPR